MNHSQSCALNKDGLIVYDEAAQCTCGAAQQPERDARDAARYRWLRGRPHAADGRPYIGIRETHFAMLNGEAADAAIDAAMQSLST